MALADDLANQLAADVIRHVDATGDEDIITAMARALGDQSQTLQEAFVTSVRVQRAAQRAAEMLAARREEMDLPPLESEAPTGAAPMARPLPAATPSRPRPRPAATKKDVEAKTTEEPPEEKKDEPAAKGPWDLDLDDL